MNRDDITLKQIDNMKHCIGFQGDRVKRKKYVAFRNYFTTNSDDYGWDKLVTLGLAKKRDLRNGVTGKCYSVSKEGIELLEGLLECKIVED